MFAVAVGADGIRVSMIACLNAVVARALHAFLRFCSAFVKRVTKALAAEALPYFRIPFIRNDPMTLMIKVEAFS